MYNAVNLMGRYDEVKDKSVVWIISRFAVAPAVLSLIFVQNLYWVVAVVGLIVWAAVLYFFEDVPGAFLGGFLLFLLISGGGICLLYFVLDTPF